MMTTKEKHLLMLDRQLSNAIDYMIEADQDHRMRTIEEEDFHEACEWCNLCTLAIKLQEHFM